jgi:hypothetical protein
VSDIVERMRAYIESHGGPAKDVHGKHIGTVWPMMLEAADELDKLRKIIHDNREVIRNEELRRSGNWG